MSLFDGLPPIGSRLSDSDDDDKKGSTSGTDGSEKQKQKQKQKNGTDETRRPPDLVPASLRPRPTPRHMQAHGHGRLISRWTAAAAVSADQPPNSPEPAQPAQPVVSLAQYLPAARPQENSRGPAVFDHRAAYCPTTPNDYHAYKTWADERKTRRGRKE